VLIAGISLLGEVGFDPFQGHRIGIDATDRPDIVATPQSFEPLPASAPEPDVENVEGFGCVHEGMCKC
jgi:hypothetical protein